jgi:hypothetical protein
VSDTPRTDAESTFAACLPDAHKVVPSDFARELERENRTLAVEVEELKQELARAYDEMRVQGYLRDV